MRTTLTSELTNVAGASDEDVRAGLEKSMAHSWMRHDLGWLSGQGGARTADLLEFVWNSYVFPDWPRRRALLERDVTYRAGLLAAYGWPRALQHMSRRSAWVGTDAIRFSDQVAPDRVVGDEGMLFVPVSVSSGSLAVPGAASTARAWSIRHADSPPARTSGRTVPWID